MTFTALQKHTALKREIAQRHRVYPRLVSQAKMKPSERDFQIGIFEAIAEDYRERAEAEESAGRLL